MTMIGKLCGPLDDEDYLGMLIDMKNYYEDIIQSYNPITRTHTNVTTSVQNKELFEKVIKLPYYVNRLGYKMYEDDGDYKVDIFPRAEYQMEATQMNTAKFKLKAIIKETDYATLALSASFFIVLIILMIGA